MFGKQDIEQIEAHNLTIKQIENQLNIFAGGISFINLNRPATIGDGIIKLSDKEVNDLTESFKHTKLSGLIKFIPASGAASRMFKSLYAYLENKKTELPEDVKEVFLRLKEFAFYNDLKVILSKDSENIEQLIKEENYKKITQYILESGLEYGSMPKGLLKFHSYKAFSRTSFEEHLVEAALYCTDYENKARIHFTVSPEHLNKFKHLLNIVRKEYETRYNVRYEINFSIQKPSTDTIAVDTDNKPFRGQNEELVFRPGGHGALIENLNDIDGDYIFIKNIDNVVPEKLQPVTTKYKMTLFALLYKIEKKIFDLQQKLDKHFPDKNLIKEITEFYRVYLHLNLSDILKNKSNDRIADFLRVLLFRPVRVCGVVINEGEPGGGPFWVNHPDGLCSLQIVETSQIDINNKEQAGVLNSSTHFNPVDLVCAIRNYKGEKYNLTQFVDYSTSFISEKSKDGKILKALELPGLWNGAMAKWTTIFVEVPKETFNPVKTINDLLRPEHQA